MLQDILGGGLASALFGTTYQPTFSSRVVDYREDLQLLKVWGQICRRNFEWSPRLGETRSVWSAKHPTPEQANAEARELALAGGYTAPKWWQWWRWNEAALPS